MDAVRLGIIGCGEIAQSHMRSLGNLQGRVRLVAAVNPSREKAEAVASCVPGVRAAQRFEDVLDEVDAVLVLLPHHLHHPVALRCLQAGKHVLVEKPMANSEQECMELIEAGDQGNVVLMVGYCLRYDPLLRRLKETIDSGTYGDLSQLSIWTEGRLYRDPGHWLARSSTAGGGLLFSLGCHYIDLVLWFMGQPLCGTHFGTRVGTPWLEGEGTSHVGLSFASGALGGYFGTWAARGSQLGTSVHAHCTEGLIEAQLGGGYVPRLGGGLSRLLLVRDGGEEELMRLDRSRGEEFDAQMEHFVDCIESGRRPLTDGRDSLQGLRVIWRLYEAAARGEVADLEGLGLGLAV